MNRLGCFTSPRRESGRWWPVGLNKPVLDADTAGNGHAILRRQACDVGRHHGPIIHGQDAVFVKIAAHDKLPRQIVWHKGEFGLEGHGHFHWRDDSIVIGVKEKLNAFEHGSPSAVTVCKGDAHNRNR